jgi:hypothetical protein
VLLGELQAGKRSLEDVFLRITAEEAQRREDEAAGPGTAEGGR